MRESRFDTIERLGLCHGELMPDDFDQAEIAENADGDLPDEWRDYSDE